MKDMHNLPAGWYQDPAGSKQHLYWNGESWREPVIEHPSSEETNASSTEPSAPASQRLAL